ncbi:MAG: prepilin-type N-terminal cleavage/methylation domain-containing protein [Lentisphaerae bacterium]|jgi:prepilin-type N-terminal cleavage/methylation domain-containing protein|nr:prepilin-type N-terminal cleavage/methylation domain-containing protein [Lentisphaerota bacterium]
MINSNSKTYRRGFTLTEVIIALAILSLVMAGAFGIFIIAQKSWYSTSLTMNASRDTSVSMSKMVFGTDGRNCLRAAIGVHLDKNYRGVYVDSKYPPEPDDNSHYLTPGNPDGSWFLIITNYNASVSWITYNKAAQNLIFWPKADISAAAKRVLIGNYIVEAEVTEFSKGLQLDLTSVRKHGSFTVTNKTSSFVKMRNKKK